MAVERAWLNRKGEIKKELTDEELDMFNEKIIRGLNRLAYLQVVDELNAENRPVAATDDLSLMYGKEKLIIK